jgi:CspA family cold shock protein
LFFYTPDFRIGGGDKQMKGTVKWFNETRGYGFIEGEDKKEVFVHRNSLPEGSYLDDGDHVEYDIEDTERGPQAINIKNAKK